MLISIDSLGNPGAKVPVSLASSGIAAHVALGQEDTYSKLFCGFEQTQQEEKLKVHGKQVQRNGRWRIPVTSFMVNLKVRNRVRCGN